MNILNKFKKSAPLLLLPVMGSAMATDILVPLNFTTLPVIEIEEITPLVFGDVLSLTQANTCVMSTSAGTLLTSAQEGADYANDYGGAATNSAGELSGDCSGDDGQVGIYEITSFADADITVSLSAGVDTEISFVPAGYVTDLDDVTPTATRETLAIGTDAGANASATLSAFADAGTNRAIIGGTITNQQPLTAGGEYATDFNLDVVYQ